MVYLAKKEDGTVVYHTSLDAMKEMDGITNADLEVSDEDFEKAGGIVRVISGKIVLGKTKEEKKAEQNQIRVAEIDKELAQLDQRAGRAARAVSTALGKSKTPPTVDVSKLEEYERACETLRRERSQLTTGVAG